MKTKIGMLLIAMCMSAMAFAQKPIEKTRVKKNFTPEQIAQKRTDIMKIRLQLDDEQTAKIYTWNLQKRKSNAKNVWNNEKHKKPSLFRSLPLLKKLLMINGNRNRKKR